MTICPIAIVAGCQKCPAFRICPVKTLLGDVPKAAPPPVVAAKPAPRADAPKPAAKPRAQRKPTSAR